MIWGLLTFLIGFQVGLLTYQFICMISDLLGSNEPLTPPLGHDGNADLGGCGCSKYKGNK